MVFPLDALPTTPSFDVDVGLEVFDLEICEEVVATLAAILSFDPLFLTSKHHEHQPYTYHIHLGSTFNLLP